MLSVPVAIDRVNEGNMDAHVEEFLKIHADRVFFCLFKNFMDDEEKLRPQLEKFAVMRDKLHETGIEAGIWLDDLGHGTSEIGYKAANKKYTPLEGVFGKSKDSFCPLDKKFVRDYASYLKTIAGYSPDVIMFDDDFRLSIRNYGIGCFCKLHREELFKSIGKKYSKMRLFNKVFTGCASSTRDAWLEVTGKSLENFARSMRKAINSVNKNIRLGCCMCIDTLDFAGTDALTLAKAFAGDTKPYFRTIGAPYWHVKASWGDSRAVAEYTRQEMSWFDGEDVEIFAEGDVYPRPRYEVPANYLECYDAYLHADNKGGILKYMFDYKYDLGYETGYIDHHIKNYDAIKDISDLFRGRKQVGVEIFEPMKKIRDWDIPKVIPPQKDFLPPPPDGKVARFFDGFIRKPYYAINSYFEKMQLLPSCSFSRAQNLVASCGIPTLYTPSDGAVVCFGESARTLPESYLSRGVVMDCTAAKILTERGIDVGFISASPCYDNKEDFPCGIDLAIRKNNFMRALKCSDKAEVVSVFRPSGAVASYFYQSNKGSFYVIGIDGFLTSLKEDTPYFANYYRQQTLRNMIERVQNKSLVCFTGKNINLSLLCAKGEDGSYAIGLFNFFIDGIVRPKIILSEPKENIKFINCSGKIEGNTVVLDGEIPPYGFAAFVVY